MESSPATDKTGGPGVPASYESNLRGVSDDQWWREWKLSKILL